MTRYGLLMLTACVVAAQPAAQTFEVGTVKVSSPESSGPFSVIPVAPGVRNGVFEARHMLLKTLLAYAHDVSEVQVSGPGWLDKNHYNVVANVPEGTQAKEVRGMLRGFLAERFRIVTHTANQEMDALALVVEEKGHKLHLMAPGDSFRPESPKGSLGLIVTTNDMRGWADFLTRVVGSPVVNQTGLEGRYAGAVAYTPLNRLGGGLSDFPAFPTALKEQAGLELIRRKMKVDVIVVDQANEIPEEN